MTLHIPVGHYDRRAEWADYSRDRWATYQVVMDDALLAPDLDGYTICAPARVIVLRSSADRETLLHETFHAIACELGINTEHKMKGHRWIYRFSPGLALVIRRNPPLVRWLSRADP